MNITKRSQKSFGAQQKELGELNGHVEEMYTGHVIVKAFGREDRSVREFKDINARLFDAAWKAQFISGVIMPMMNFINNIGYVVICVVGGIMAARKALKLGDIQAFIQYSRQFTQPIAQTANIANVLQSTLASAERVLEVLEEEEQVPESADAISVAMPRGHVEFRHVRFGYKEDAILMKDMNIKVEPGQTIAIVGPTGAGKTTLVNLLMRFYEISGGAILIDGIDTRDMRRGELRTLFGMVLQDTWLFNGTIRENIAYGREGATEEDIVAAAKAAHADHFIRALPEGYDTRPQRGGLQHLPGREAAPHHRAGHTLRTRHPHPGRGDTRRLVEDEDGVVREYGPRYRDELLFALRYVGGLLVEHRPVALGQGRMKWSACAALAAATMSSSVAPSRPYAMFSRIVPLKSQVSWRTIPNIFAARALHVPRIDPVDQNRTARDLVETHEEVDESGLARRPSVRRWRWSGRVRP